LTLLLMCLPYVVFGSVIWAAYHDSGRRSLLDRGAPVAPRQVDSAVAEDAWLRDLAKALGPPARQRALGSAALLPAASGPMTSSLVKAAIGQPQATSTATPEPASATPSAV
jgi:hypothetical protein